MPEKPSRSIRETRDKEAWLAQMLDGEAARRDEAVPLLATAALVRGTVDAIHAPSEAEEAARQRALAEFSSLRPQEAARDVVTPRPPRAPWIARFGSAMRFVFTLGRRR